MSCIMSNPEPLAAIANTLAALMDLGFDYFGFDAPDELFDETRGCRGRDGRLHSAELIYRRLYELNARAYNGRYAGHPEGPVPEAAPCIDVAGYTLHEPVAYEDGHAAVRPWHYRATKLLDFWLYQVEDGATGKDPFVHAVRLTRDFLARFIVCNSEQYHNAPGWGEL